MSQRRTAAPSAASLPPAAASLPPAAAAPGGGGGGTAATAVPSAAATTSAAADLRGAAIPLQAMREYARQLLLKMFSAIPGQKSLVIDPSFVGPLGLLAEVQFLRGDCGVSKIHLLQPGAMDSPSPTLVYLCRPTLEAVRCIGDHVRHQRSVGQKKEYAVHFVPRPSMVVERALEEEGVHEFVAVGSFDVDLIALDKDVLSMEDLALFREVFVQGDRSGLHQIALSVMRLQSIFGIIPNIKAVGGAAKGVLETVLRQSKALPVDHPSQKITPEIDTLILIDRTVDLITPMCTQLTYEGIVDEVFSIQFNYIKVEPRLIGLEDAASIAAANAQGGRVSASLNSNDRIFAQIRDMNCAALKRWLSNQAIEIDSFYKKRHELSELSEMRDFMRGLGSYRQAHDLLKVHTNIATEIFKITSRPSFRDLVLAEQNVLMGNLDASYKYLEECIDRQDSLMKVLRLLVLLSQAGGGIRAKQYDYLRKEIVESFGFEHTLTLDNLERCGMLRSADRRFGVAQDYGAIRKRMNLFVENVNEQDPHDPAYVYSGYCPLTTRLVQAALRPSGWREIDDVLRQIPGMHDEVTQRLPQGVDRVRLDEQGHPRNRVVMVFFVGGCTFTEISTLRFLGRQMESVDFIAATTKVITGDRLLQSLMAPTPVPTNSE